MSRIEPYIQLHLWGVRPSAELEETIATASTHLSPYRKRIDRALLHVGRWSLHHGQGTLFRVTLAVEPAGGGAVISLEEETEVGAPATSLGALVDTVFQRAAPRLARG
ncbi:MAG: hypothetical protein ABW352_10085 [Polyangiales bacterium]